MSRPDAAGGPPLDRARFRAELRADPNFDALIVGGGIAGAATLRELAAQGLRALLVERADFASGASGGLTRVAQGGFRYLERGEIGLVRRAVTERNLFVAAAPHQTRPIRVVLPTETLAGGAFSTLLRALRLRTEGGLPGAFVLRLGVALYQALGAGTEILPRGGLFSRVELARIYPGIAPRFAGAAYEYEAVIASPERVAIELIEDAVLEGAGAVALNYAEVGAKDGGLAIRDTLDGARFEIRPRAIVNAAGANVDRVNKLFGLETRFVDGVAGTHVLIEAPEIAEALGDDLMFFEDGNPDPSRRRLCCAYRAGNLVLLGATEIPVADPDASRPRADEDAYLLAALGGLFPDSAVDQAPIRGRLHGVRPLVAADQGDVTGRSRDHAIHTHLTPDAGLPLVSIAGGKWTTFRAIASDAADAVLAALAQPRRVSTQARRIGGGRDFPDSVEDRRELAGLLMARSGVGGFLAERLIATYGSRALRVADYLKTPADRRAFGDSALTYGEVTFFRREEMAVRVEDIAHRRSRLFLEGHASQAVLAEIAAVFPTPIAAFSG